ncbi:hypothetical protein H6A08_09430 [Enorma massiliensis]|nr:hypothetical protein [Enorma massiliensis]MBM6784571.1 hypothetical protein [Enorma massiliensis]
MLDVYGGSEPGLAQTAVDGGGVDEILEVEVDVLAFARALGVAVAA